jgi:hypothetical protein
VLRNLGGRRFAPPMKRVTARRAFAVAAGDLNADGHSDLAVASAGQPVDLTVLLGRGDGTFGPAQRSAGPRAEDVALADLDGDGRLDVVLATYRPGMVVFRPGRGDGTFGPARRLADGKEPFGLAIADLDGDGDRDVVAADYGADRLLVILGDGHGGFPIVHRRPGGAEIDAVAVADLDGDGRLDLAASGSDGPAVFLGAGDGTFGPRRVIDDRWSTVGAAVGDFDADGRPDLAFGLTEIGEEEFVTDVIAFLNWSTHPAPPCIVPELFDYYDAHEREINVRLPAAVRRITRAACTVGRVTSQHSRTVPAGRVITQQPGPNAVLPSGGSVDLVVSRGSRRA